MNKGSLFSLKYSSCSTIGIVEGDYRVTYLDIRFVHTMKIMHIESKLIHITCVHTECALTTIRIECTFSQSTSMNCELTHNE